MCAAVVAEIHRRSGFADQSTAFGVLAEKHGITEISSLFTTLHSDSCPNLYYPQALTRSGTYKVLQKDHSLRHLTNKVIRNPNVDHLSLYTSLLLMADAARGVETIGSRRGISCDSTAHTA
jgi:hypothetical protein